ncbi:MULTISPECIES: HAD family hydrolase [unclassified Mycoplasma]|uniref:HAD family hydrolase n=1 Tax=unclassified Mycoplasma TaxID=2683645 RepID=UPI00211CA0E2|nr:MULTISPECIES: HAD family hydrolase [unclassified Mycoplasma]UUM20051.1 HAD family hydrolase [Mycoplasma sp. 1578d]UUM25031.1 HAD family hydrolase [Mycoplasma sp. 3686d]
MTKNKWAIFSDVDGTIYSFPDKKLTAGNLEKIHELKEKDIPFILNTGNPPYKKIQNLADQTHAPYIVSSNGALVYDNINKKTIFIEKMPLEEVEKIWAIADEINAMLYYFGTDQYYVKNMTKKWFDFLVDFTEYNEFQTHGKIVPDIHKIEVYGEPEDIERFYNIAMKRNINLNIINLKTHIEITKYGISKATGMAWVCKNVLNMDVQDAMAIGDSPNDISMLEVSNYSYAMDNADDLTKKSAKFYTSDVEQSGLAEAIDDYLYRTDFELKRFVSQKGKK